MPIASTDLALHASANMPDSDSGSNGGAVDTLRRLDFTQLAADDDVEAVSSNAGDTMNITVEARKADGTIASETIALNGTTAVILSTLGIVERVLSAELASAPAGTVTVRRSVAGATIRAIPAAERGFLMMFRKTAAEPSGGSQKDYFTKGFWRNGHGSLALLSAVVDQESDTDGVITHLLAASVGDSATSTNRITAPGAADTQDPDTFDDTQKAVPGTDLAAGASCGVWFRMRLPAGDSPHRYSYESKLSGESV